MRVLDFSQLDSLVSIITSSVEKVKSEWRRQGYGAPSLDSIEPHEMDDSHDQTLQLKHALQTIEGACAQLVATVSNPSHSLINAAMGAYDVTCLRVVYETKLADHLACAGDQGLHVSNLSEKTGVESGKLGRILRLLASRHIFREVKNDVFANNRLSIRLRSSNSLLDTLGHLTDECCLAAMHLHEVLLDPDWGTSYAPEKVALAKAYDLEGKTTFAYYTQLAQGKERGERFARGMSGWSQCLGANDLTTAYPWGSLASNATITDVGSGVGHISMSVACAFPNLKFVLQDLPPVMEDGQKFWRKHHPEAIEKKSVNFVPIDFLKESPIEGSDVYYLKNIAHDWPDKECIAILTNIRKSMKPGSKLLIQEYILQHANRVPATEALFQQAPEPLLPNYGVGWRRRYNLDINMMCLFNSKERTLGEFLKLGKSAGLKFLNIYDTGETGIVEFCLA